MVRYLLDTNIVIAHFARDPDVAAYLTPEASLYISSVVLGELYFGAAKSARSAANTERIDLFTSKNPILNCTLETARLYGRIKHELRLKGRPIPDNDAWIAAVALQHDLVLATGDSHFNQVANLRVEKW